MSTISSAVTHCTLLLGNRKEEEEKGQGVKEEEERGKVKEDEEDKRFRKDIKLPMFLCLRKFGT